MPSCVSGVPFLSGFWSKEAILLGVQGSSVVAWVPACFWIGLLTARLTALYTTRMMWLVFFAPAQHDPHHQPERKRYFVVLAVLVLLAIGSMVFGWVLPSEKAFHEFLRQVVEASTFADPLAQAESQKGFVFALALGAVLLGIRLGTVRYRQGMPTAEAELQGLWGQTYTGYVRSYAFVMPLGVFLVLVAMLFYSSP